MYSMTGFGRGQVKNDWGSAVWEIRSINHRYLEVTIRLPELVRELEPSVRQAIQASFKRGKIECSLGFSPGSKLSTSLTLNQPLLNQLRDLVLEIKSCFPPHVGEINIMDILAWKGVLAEENIDINALGANLIASLETAIIDLKDCRQREGQILIQGIHEKIERLREQVDSIKKSLPELLDKQRKRILERLEEAKVGLDLQRLEQEMVYFAQKIDISEELERIIAHLFEVTRTLMEKNTAVGRRLDFMMQELNREANTLGSKSTDPLIIHAAVEMKVLIEQIREQVQNIE